MLSLLVSLGIYSSITGSLKEIIDNLKSYATNAQQHSQDLQTTSKSLSANASEAALSISEPACKKEAEKAAKIVRKGTLSKKTVTATFDGKAVSGDFSGIAQCK